MASLKDEQLNKLRAISAAYPEGNPFTRADVEILLGIIANRPPCFGLYNETMKDG